MEIKECIETRRSVRRYTDEPIPRETVLEIVRLASFAPSWKNTQTPRYMIVTDRQLMERIADECVLGFQYNTQTLTRCTALAVQSVVTNISGMEKDGSASTSKGSTWEVFDAGISAQTFCLAAHSLGVGTCIMGIFDDEKIAAQIGLPENQRVSALIAMGVPAETPSMPRRREASELVRFLDGRGDER